MAFIANGQQTDDVKAAAEAYLDRITEVVADLIPAGSPDGARFGSIGSAALGMLVERMTHRFGPVAGWAAAGQGLGMAFAQMPSDTEIMAAKLFLEEGISLGYSTSRAALAPSSPIRQ